LKPEYGYGRYPNVITSLEFERVLSATGPCGGHVQRPSDGQEPKKIAWIQCVGSRDASIGRERGGERVMKEGLPVRNNELIPHLVLFRSTLVSESKHPNFFFSKTA
jgi:hypothetical protein